MRLQSKPAVVLEAIRAGNKPRLSELGRMGAESRKDRQWCIQRLREERIALEMAQLAKQANLDTCPVDN